MSIEQLSFEKQKDIEKLFATSALIHPVETVRQCGWLKPESLLNIQVKEMWQRLVDRIQPDMTDDEGTAISTSIAIECGMAGELMDRIDLVGWLYTPQSYAQEIIRRNYLSTVGTYIGKLAQEVAKQDDSALRALIDELYKLEAGGKSSDPNALDVADKFQKAVFEGCRSVDTFIPTLDASLGGLERQTLTIVAARTSMGKTALIWQIARNVAISGQKVIFFSLEMSATALWARAACPLVGLTWRDVRGGNLGTKQKEDLLAESYKLAAQYADNLIILDGVQTTDTIWQTSALQCPQLVIIDHLRLVKDKGENENKRQGYITERLKDMAKALNCPVLLAAQINRAPEGRGTSDKRPRLSDLRDSGEIEENADVVLMLYRESYYSKTPKTITLDPTEIWIRKFRDGPANGLIKLNFDARKEWYESARP